MTPLYRLFVPYRDQIYESSNGTKTSGSQKPWCQNFKTLCGSQDSWNQIVIDPKVSKTLTLKVAKNELKITFCEDLVIKLLSNIRDQFLTLPSEYTNDITILYVCLWPNSRFIQSVSRAFLNKMKQQQLIKIQSRQLNTELAYSNDSFQQTLKSPYRVVKNWNFVESLIFKVFSCRQLFQLNRF